MKLHDQLELFPYRASFLLTFHHGFRLTSLQAPRLAFGQPPIFSLAIIAANKCFQTSGTVPDAVDVSMAFRLAFGNKSPEALGCKSQRAVGRQLAAALWRVHRELVVRQPVAEFQFLLLGLFVLASCAIGWCRWALQCSGVSFLSICQCSNGGTTALRVAACASSCNSASTWLRHIACSRRDTDARLIFYFFQPYRHAFFSVFFSR